ncbi:THAP domain-containing protein [Operophtera brumata]|uniref:THAP domain-containing protein n=1 Tax=Operophtera brumata TaxID=104452 RepID=A0A0L7LCS7_OPEBR|nr:THAP domain-containing protein [Operophtera brumata]
MGYFLVKGTSAKLKAQLVTKAFELVNETGVEIKALTCDGARANLAMAAELGCCLDSNKLQTTIIDSTTGQRAYFFLDPSHMLKLIRNTFGDYKCFFDGDGNKIQWLYIEALHRIQEEELFFMANKLRANHIYFKTKIMNVRLAAQLFSKSVADALIFCQNELDLPDFNGVSATAKFILLINDVFDILDSRSRQKRLKRALNAENFEIAFQKLDEAKTVLTRLCACVKKHNNESSKIPLLQSPRYTGFLGFLICIESAKSLFQDLVQDNDNGLNYMPLHRISQDHIELFFSNVRSHGGYSDNPTAQKFEAIYKKLLINTEMTLTAKGAYCISLEKIEILNCSPSVEKINSTIVREYNDTCNERNDDVDFTDDIESQIFLSPFGEKVVEYIAGQTSKLEP